MTSPVINIGCVANLFSRQMHFENVGDIEYGHTHQFDHLTLLAHGSLEITVEGVKSVFTAPKMIYIHKDKLHELVALEPNTVAYCIHALRGLDGEVLDPSMIPAGVDPLSVAAPITKRS